MLTQTFILEPDKRPAHDFAMADHGSIVTFHPLTVAAQQWWAENVNAGPSIGNAYAVEPRYVLPLVDGIEAEGFTIT